MIIRCSTAISRTSALPWLPQPVLQRPRWMTIKWLASRVGRGASRSQFGGRTSKSVAALIMMPRYSTGTVDVEIGSNRPSRML